MEKDHNENNKRRLSDQEKFNFIGILKIFCVILFISVLTPFIQMALKGNREIFLALYLAQAVTSIISIGLIILLTGVIKETKFGMSISRYIMAVKPRIFKLNYIIILSLLINAVNCVCIINNYYALSYILFFVSLCLFLFMLNILMDLLRFKDEISKDIGNYIIEYYKQDHSLLENF